MSPILQAVLASSAASLLGLIGGFLLLWQHQGVKHWSQYFVSFAAGALLGAAFFDLLPEAIEEFPDSVTSIFSWLMVGFLLFFLIEKFFLWHHHTHGDEDAEKPHAVAPLIIAGDAIHNLIDGIVIGAAFLVNPALGVTTAVAVLAHELPQEIGDFGILVHGGMKRRAIALWNILGALVSPIATILTIWLAGSVEGLEMPLLGLAAGMFIYIAAADLVPEIHKSKRLYQTIIQLLLLILGTLAILAIGAILPHEH